MARALEFFFDYVSPTAYLAWFEAPKTAARAGAELVYKPMFLGGVMQGSGNKPPGLVPAKAKYMNADIPRCARRIGVPFHFNPAFPMNTLKALRATIGLEGEARFRFMDACFKEAWGKENPVDLGKEAVLREIAASCGLDPDAVIAMGSDEALKAKLTANTEEALSRGVFGAPSFLVGDELFFGHDRLDHAEDALRA